MASKAQKLLQRLRQTKRGWSARDLHTILVNAGFEWRESGHRVYRHPVHRELGSYPIPREKDLAPQYARDVLRRVEEVERREDQQGGQ